MRTKIFTSMPGVRPRERRLLGAAALVPIVTGAVVELAPARFRLSTTPLVLHAVSFRGPLALALSASGVISFLTVRLGRSTVRPWRRITLTAALLSTGIGHAGVLLRRGWATPALPGHADLVVVSLNTLAGAATPEQVAALVTTEMSGANAAMVALPETTATLAKECAELLAEQGFRFQVFSTSEGPRESDSTSLLVSERMGIYRQLPSPKMLLGAVVAVPANGSGPTFAAVHPGAPVPSVGYPQWRDYVTSAVDICRHHEDSVVAGDFNTTIDHAMMRDLAPCFDAAVAAGRGAEGTWPSHFPAPLAAPIDHVLVNGGYSVLGTRTERVGASDHRAVIARLRRVQPLHS